jgi:hypothetical protein
MELRMESYHRTLKGLVHTIYNSQRSSSAKRNMQMPTYSKEELRLWLFSQSLYFELFDKWRISGYKRMEVPSVDRKDDKKSYSFDNIQLMTFRENNKKSHNDRKSGKLITAQNKKVDQFTKDGIFINSYYSIGEVARVLNIKSPSKISEVCTGSRKSAYGSLWAFSLGGVPSV